MFRFLLTIVLAASALLPILPLPTAHAFQETESAAPPAQETAVDFAQTIKPFLETYCIRCHGPNKSESFRVDVRDDLMAYITAEDPESSDLYTSLTTDDEDLLMPPAAEAVRPTKAEIRLVRDWIKQGAAWPEGVTLSDPADAAKPALAQDITPGQKLWVGAGALHPAAVHMPIGLLLGAGLFALLGIRGNFVMSDCAYYCLWVGSLTSIVASVLGWSYAINEGYGGDFQELFDMEKSIFWHRISGLAVSVASLLLALYAAAARSSDPDDGFLWKLGAILLAAGVGIVGHQGGKLTYGDNHYKVLYEAVEEMTGLDLGTKAAGDKEKSAAPNDGGDAKTPAVGQTSNEQQSAASNSPPDESGDNPATLKSEGNQTKEGSLEGKTNNAENKSTEAGSDQAAKTNKVD